jgi:multiple sugar transport system permease protein
MHKLRSWVYKIGIGLTVIGALIYGLFPLATETPAKFSGQVIEIRFLVNPEMLGIPDLIQEFERESLAAHRKNPALPIYRVITGQSGARDISSEPTRFLTSVAGGDPPDVIAFNRNSIAEYATRNTFLPLNPFLEKDRARQHPDAVLPERFYAWAWEEVVQQDQVYGIPYDVDSRALFYNKDHLRRAGLVDASGEPVPPRTWPELREYARRLTQYDEKGKIKVLGFSPTYGNAFLYIYGFTNGGEFVTPDNRQMTLTDPRNVEALQFMVDIHNDLGGYRQVGAFGSSLRTGALDPFLAGRVSMMFDISERVAIMATYDRNLDYGVVNPPLSLSRQQVDATPVSWGGGWAYCIPANTRNPEAAWEFIRFLVSERAWKIYNQSLHETISARGFLYVPFLNPIVDLNEKFLNQYVFHNPQMPENIKQAYRVFIDLLPHTRILPQIPVAASLFHWQATATEEACYGQKSPFHALDYANAVLQRDLDRLQTPSSRPPISNWNFFYWGYGALILCMLFGAFFWDASFRFRRMLSQFFSPGRKISAGDLVPGARGGYFRQQWRAGYLFMAPWLIGFIVFCGGPLLFSILMSFCDYEVLSGARWTGLENFRVFFQSDELVPVAFYNTLFMILGIPLSLIVSLSIALLLNLKIRGISVWRTLFYLPAIVPGVASMVMWSWILNPNAGLLNKLLEMIGIPGPLWLQHENWSKPALILMGLWQSGGGMLMWLAGLKNISEQYYEAALIDGAGHWQQFRHITIPMLTPYIFFNLIMGLIGVFQIFEIAFVMTLGGPVNSTLFYVYHLFNHAYRYGHMGYASAMAWILFIVILGLTLLQFKLARRWVFYED